MLMSEDFIESLSPTQAKEYLLKVMQSLSEEFWCCEWAFDLEYILFRDLVEEKSKYLSHSDRDKLISLYHKAGGWWYWPNFVDPIKFIHIKDWVRIYKEKRY